MIARYPGTCKACRRPYAKGERIAVLAARGPRGGKQWGHLSCAHGSSPSPSSTPYVPASAASGPCTGFRWTTVPELAAAVPPEFREPHYFAGDDFGAAVRLVAEGDHRPATVARIAAAREKARNVLLHATDRATWARDFAGYAVSVPHLLAGSPRCMIRPAMEASMTAPLRIWVDPGASCSVHTDELDERGGVLAGICEAISAHRPVELCVFRTIVVDMRGADVTTRFAHLADAYCLRVDWRDPAAIAPMLGGTFVRGISLREHRRWQACADLGIPIFGKNQCRYADGMPQYVSTLREMLPGAGPDDLVIPMMVSGSDVATADTILATVLRLYGAEPSPAG